MIRTGPNEERIIKEVSDRITGILDAVGLFYRLFYRIKTPDSFEKKLKEKKEKYIIEHKKIQDVFGLRITLYFSDDETIAIELIKRVLYELPNSHSIDFFDGETFGPSRCNLVFEIPNELLNSSSLFEHEFVDTTLEIQFRTVFSEGWHEIEHDFRYKCKQEWQNERLLSRQLNGQLATLESCNWTILKILDELAYKKYRENEWSSFLRNIMRIRFADDTLSNDVIEVLNKNKQIAKELLRHDRNNLILPIAALTNRIPLIMDHVLHIINRKITKNEALQKLEPTLLTTILDNSFM